MFIILANITVHTHNADVFTLFSVVILLGKIILLGTNTVFDKHIQSFKNELVLFTQDQTFLITIIRSTCVMF